MPIAFGGVLDVTTQLGDSPSVTIDDRTRLIGQCVGGALAEMSMIDA